MLGTIVTNTWGFLFIYLFIIEKSQYYNEIKLIDGFENIVIFHEKIWVELNWKMYFFYDIKTLGFYLF